MPNEHVTACGHCGAIAHQSQVGITEVTHDGNSTSTWASHRCDACGRFTIREDRIYEVPVADEADQRIGYTQRRDVFWYPSQVEWRRFPDVPQQIADAASEATACLSFGAYRAAGALARAVIEATCKERGAGGQSLAARIETLASTGAIRPGTAESAHEVRHFGNTMAHGDFADATTEAEASEALEFMNEVLAEVYQHPARRARARERRMGTASS
jgi:hypothetical protein